MALESATPTPAPSAQVVGHAFVEQYYHILHQSPESVYRFYQDSSVLSRPDPNGIMTTVTTMKGINEKILSLDYKDFKAEIKTADAQKSYEGGVIVMVTGCLTGKDNLKRKFTQSFFLAPQDNGYYVLNDVFRYVEDIEPVKVNPANEIDKPPAAPLTPDPEPTYVPDSPSPESATSLGDDNQIDVKEAQDKFENEIQSTNDKVVVAESESNSTENDASAVAESASSSALEDAPKKSYASIVSSLTKMSHSPVMKGNAGPVKIYQPTYTVRGAPVKTEKQSSGTVAPSALPTTSGTTSSSPHEGSNSYHEGSNSYDEVDGYSIYVRNLPFNVMVSELETTFRKFGPIKQGGVQVRSHKHLGHCFGFVEFQSLSSMNSAIQASPVMIGGRQAVVEIKKTTTRVGGGGRGRFTPGRGAFRSESFRGRGNFGGGRGYGRNEFMNRGEFSGRGKGPVGRSGENYQQMRGRGGRPSRSNQNDVSA